MAPRTAVVAEFSVEGFGVLRLRVPRDAAARAAVFRRAAFACVERFAVFREPRVLLAAVRFVTVFRFFAPLRLVVFFARGTLRR
jgi:hypothetical protein